MTGNRHKIFGIFLLFIVQILVSSVFSVSVYAGTKEAENASFSILDAAGKGIFNIGPARGDLKGFYDEGLSKQVLKFDYSVPQGSIIGVWTNSYPSDLDADAADALGIRVKAPKDELGRVVVSIEIKGRKVVQKVPITLKEGWNYAEEAIDWNMIGALKEVVFVVSPIGSDEPTKGTLYLAADFIKLTPLQKNFIFVKVGFVIVLSVVIALIAAILWLLSGRGEEKHKIKEGPGRIYIDIVYGVVSVLIAVSALKIFSFGESSSVGAGLGFLAVGLAGAVIAEILKFCVTGRHLTPGEVFQDVLLSGLLAASASRLGILQAPSSWAQVLMLNRVMAFLAFIVYHVSNASSIVKSGKHLRGITGSLIVMAPYLLGWLLLVENANLLRALSDRVTAGILSAWPAALEIIGRTFVIFIFNEIFTNGMRLVTKGRILKEAKAHLLILSVSLGVVIAPLIADLGSGEAIAALPEAVKAVISILTSILSFAGLWAEVYLITGIALDGGKRKAPSMETISAHVVTGVKKGMAYIGILMTILYAVKAFAFTSLSQAVMSAFPVLIGIIAGAAVFPLIKTIIETFDGSMRFFDRMRYSYRDFTLYARGAVAGFGFSYMITHELYNWGMSDRILFGLTAGFLASAGVSILRDIVYALKGRGRIQSWRLYLVDAALGVFVGSAVAFYLDALQIPVVVEKFKLYTTTGFQSVDYITYPLVNKWGRIDLGSYTGGSKLIFTESLAGVINWAIAAWLFAINKVFLQAFFEKQTAPIKFFFSKAGFATLIEHMIYVLRWGLWMSPIIFTFLRMMPDPAWYNQDGAIRTLFATFNNITMSPEAFRAWSLKIFVYILAFDFFRVLIWMDHMGLRVATLVNLSFIGLDRLDERVARFIGRSAAQRYIPEAIKRFATWAPLLIPFYLPRGDEWDYVWNTSGAMQAAAAGRGGIISAIGMLSLPQKFLFALAGVVVFTALSFIIRSLVDRSCKHRLNAYELSNREYKVVAKANGEVYSEVLGKEIDISRRSYDTMDPCGRILYIADTSQWRKSKKRSWPVVGNFPHDKFGPSRIYKLDGTISVLNESNGIKTSIDISLPDKDTTAEIWEITVENLSDGVRKLKVVPYLEWVLNGGMHDRFHTQYARLFPEMEYVSNSNAVLSWQKNTGSMGVIASNAYAEGFLVSRVDFIGRGRSVWKPRALETLNFLGARDTSPYPTFDPIGSLVIDASLDPKVSKKIRLVIGYAKDRAGALALVKKCLKTQITKPISKADERPSPLIGHGEILPATPQPYWRYSEDGNKLYVHTPYTPRPFDHAMSNAAGHSVTVTNRGLHTSCNGNAQQNRLTPDWADTVSDGLPSEAIYLYDPDRHEWYSPTYHPLNEDLVRNECEFSVDGTAVFHMTYRNISTELTVFVPPDDPTGVYLLKVKNDSDHSRRMRVAPYFQTVLEFQPERSGVLQVKRGDSGELFFNNPRNTFRNGWAFASMSVAAECVETNRGRFFGKGRRTAHPFMVEKAAPDKSQLTDPGQIAGLMGTIEIPAHGEYTVAIVLGQTDKFEDAKRLAKKYKDINTVKNSLAATRKWWLGLMGTLEIKTDKPDFDRMQNWLKYQAVAERVWARRGFYQTSGAFGFRDQLQDTVNLMWVDPAFARKQIILHASQQFFEGDVFHWFFTLTDGRTAFACRSHASDNLLWLAWGVVEYIKATGDSSILDETTSYIKSEFPFAGLPKNKAGWGHLYHRSTLTDPVYRHCLKAIDLVLEKRMGAHGLPLIMAGDWNDGLDEIGSEGRGESVWLGFFLYYILKDMVDIIDKRDGASRREHYVEKMNRLKEALESTWREDRYLRAIHDDGTEIGIKGSGVWEIDALTAAWAVMTGINPERGLKVFDTAISVLEKDNVVLLGYPALREDTKPYLGRSSKYPEGVRENGMYCHGVQWLIRASRILAERFDSNGDGAVADKYRATAYRLWRKITPVSHVTEGRIEIYGGQPNKQPADILTTYDPGRMIWNGYTGAAGWLLRQSFEGVAGASLVNNELILPADIAKPRGDLKIIQIKRDVKKSPIK